MNNLFYTLLAIILMTSCSKEALTDVCIDDVCIDGEWTWVESSGSFAGVTITPESETSTRKVEIDINSYREFVNGVLTLEQDYEFVQSTELDDFSTTGLVLKLAEGNWFAVSRTDDMLVLYEPCADCWTHVYNK